MHLIDSRSTYPPSSIEDFVGKEHFWWTGDEVGLSRVTTGGLFNKLIYPLRAKTATWQDDEILVPASIGLEIMDRREAGLPNAPTSYNFGRDSTGKSQRLHKANKNGTKFSPADAALQIRGLLELAQHEDLLFSIAGMKGKTSRHYSELTKHLSHFVLL